MDVQVTTRERPSENDGVWTFDVVPFLMEKGTELTSGGREDQGAPSVILARRKLIEATGVTKASERTAQAEYSGRRCRQPPAAPSTGSPEH